MIQEIICDIFKAPVDAIVHCCNCQTTMGSGIAKALRDAYPEVYEADIEAAKAGLNLLGFASIAEIKNPLDPEKRLKVVFNLYGQFDFGGRERCLNYEAFYQGLWQVEKRLGGTGLVLGIPYKIGSDRAGGNWRIVKTMIEEVFSGSVEAIICKHPDFS